MKQFIPIVLSFFIIHPYAYGQAPPAAKISSNNNIRFSSINSVGLLTGTSGEALSLQTINGVSINKWFAGAGVGFDYYATRTIPLFVDLRRELSSKKNTPFLYADAGFSIPWANDAQKWKRGNQTKFKKGLFYDAGIGWKLRGKNDRGFVFSAGYSFKQVKEEVDVSWWSWWPVQPGEQGHKEYFDSRLSRVTIKFGLQL